MCWLIDKFSDNGAGGEKVLWTAIKAIQNNTESLGKKGHEKIVVLVYSGSQMQADEILEHKVYKRFGIDIDKTKVHFVQISKEMHEALDPKNYPTMTMVWQALAYIKVVFTAVQEGPCDVFVDTMGVGFSFPFLKIFCGMKVYSYTHYPFISRDMIETVRRNKDQYNNQATGVKKHVKLFYYQIIYYFYKLCGMFCDKVACNSNWTRGHMDELWSKAKDDIATIYPPCDTTCFKQIDIDDASKRENMMVSFAQFRPEKQHQLQLEIWNRVLQS